MPRGIILLFFAFLSWSETSTSSFGIFRLFAFKTIIGKFRTKSVLLLFFL